MTIDSDTRIAYPDGATRTTGRVQHLSALEDGRWAVVLDATAAHPVDPTWPDQGADRGALVLAGESLDLLDCRIGAWQDGELHVGDRLPARLGSAGWSFVVVHVVQDASLLSLGDAVEVEVDPEYRGRLSRGHTACHLASLALNAAVASFWSKPARADSLGSPDFDQAAIRTSVIRESGSTDVYRLGTSLRRSGVDIARLVAETAAVQRRIDGLLAEWIATGADVEIHRDDDLLSTRRTWRCTLPAGPAAIPCGGTHVDRLSEFAQLRVRLVVENEGTSLRMETDAL
ncbi:alanyl-tRNA synthetase [Rathayibacter tanaceti]|uniref:Alanine--tRNA ligase n=3 Tax=Rathayibacter tanaceti TaxID=1671680 RepID=A0A162FY77_9MICO|nr:Alanine--tRNA ligase [Rathayibacter tanaceti]QHC57063.1 metal-dependent hydrolase [Rathayibacter tanaceti]TCO36999.1 alanyl-tRNA synthetase [Rathayibacter tanaceti]